MAKAKKGGPSGVMRLLRFFMAAVQLISSCIVGGIIFYFVALLVQDGQTLPWTFVFLLVVSILSLLAFFASLCCGFVLGKHPRASIVFSCVLSILWTIAFALLGWWSRGTLGSTCNVEDWEEDEGVRVCLLYKALFAFSLFGFLATLFLVMLDLYFFRRTAARGEYNKMPEDHGNEHKPVASASTTNLGYSNEAPYSLNSSNPNARYSDNQAAARKEYEVQQEHKAEYALGENASYYDPAHAAQKPQAANIGYVAPKYQEDTSYKGAAGKESA